MVQQIIYMIRYNEKGKGKMDKKFLGALAVAVGLLAFAQVAMADLHSYISKLDHIGIRPLGEVNLHFPPVVYHLTGTRRAPIRRLTPFRLFALKIMNTLIGTLHTTQI